MSRIRVLRVAVPLTAVAIVAGAAAAFGDVSENFTPPTAPTGTVAYLKASDANGPIVGTSTTKARPGQILVIALEFGVEAPYNSGNIGQTACDGVTFRKPVDISTPRWYQDAENGDRLTSAVFDESAATASPSGAGAGLLVTLTSVAVTAVHTVDGGKAGLNYEDVTLHPDHVVISWPGHGSTSFNCTAPVT